MRISLTLALLVLSASGCAEAERIARGAMDGAAGDPGTVETTAASWRTTATEYRGHSGRYGFDCPPNDGSDHSVWGSNPYTDDSSVCWAGVHAGVITPERGGRVTIEPRPGQNRYVGSSRNGRQTRDYGSWAGSFAVVR